ncbi:fibronectin type III domain-containing protein [Collimonas humicola]|uniref:fibronectin type III domain-containing protein n=1 Tax=Collimonas humicola TaxID=2825886 RepID=UPI001B8C9EED|nr:fibronectin type III domain-containing protein [Collimonas humicola]
MTAEYWDMKFSRTPIVRTVDVSHNSITLAWSAPVMDRTITAYQFMVRKGDPSGPQVPTDALANTNGFPPYRHVIASLTPKTVYYIQVRGVDSTGDASNWSRQQVYKTL